MSAKALLQKRREWENSNENNKQCFPRFGAQPHSGSDLMKLLSSETDQAGSIIAKTITAKHPKDPIAQRRLNRSLPARYIFIHSMGSRYMLHCGSTQHLTTILHITLRIHHTYTYNTHIQHTYNTHT